MLTAEQILALTGLGELAFWFAIVALLALAVTICTTDTNE